MKTKSRSMPSLHSDAAALPQDDLSCFKPMHFEIEPKSAALNMRLPIALLDALKNKAKARGIPYTRYVRMLLETDIIR